MKKIPLGNRELIRDINRSIILNAIKNAGMISRVELAQKTGLSAATVTGITGKLIAEGLIFEKTLGYSSGGRPPILLAINPRGGFVIGIKLMETCVVGAMTDLNATTEAEMSIDLPDKTLASVTDTLVNLVQRLVKKTGIPFEQIFGVGIGVAGVVDSTRGILRQSPFFGWENVNLRELLESRLSLPVYIDNDVNALTVGELWCSPHPPADDFIVITIGRGIGMGIVINGQIYRGKSGGAGEIGHIVIDNNGPLCDCGKHGCLESYLSDRAILEEARKAVGVRFASIQQLVEKAELGDQKLLAVLSHAGDLLGKQIANLINIFDPKLIILGGEGVRIGKTFFASMEKSLHENVMPGLAKDTEIRIAQWGDDIWARGAASLVIGMVFNSPIQKEERE